LMRNLGFSSDPILILLFHIAYGIRWKPKRLRASSTAFR
jgi:hypothetical protein